jgi:hypothetical protein
VIGLMPSKLKLKLIESLIERGELSFWG